MIRVIEEVDCPTFIKALRMALVRGFESWEKGVLKASLTWLDIDYNK